MKKNKPKDLALDKIDQAITKRIQFNHASEYLKEWIANLDPNSSNTSRIERLAEEFYRICLYGETEQTRLRAIQMFFAALENKTSKDVGQPMINLTIQNIDQKIDEYLGPKVIEGSVLDNKIKEIVE
jgi:hypothetical protein